MVIGTRCRYIVSWFTSYRHRPIACQVIFFLAFFSGDVSAAPTPFSSADDDQGSHVVPGLIQCPDWQQYVSPVYGVDAQTPQTLERFVARTRDTGVTRRTPDQDTTVQAASLLPRAACTHTIAKGDTLGKIAADTLGTSARWTEIAAVNPGIQPKRLRVGQTIQLPCAASDRGVTPALSPPETPPETASRRWSWWPFGRNEQTSQDKNPDSRTSTSAGQAPVAASTPDAKVVDVPPLPTWEASKNEYLRDVLQRWGDQAGYTVIIDTSDAWQLGVAIRLKAEFEAAVDELVSGLAHDGTPPRVRIYPNAVVRLGGPL